MQFGDGVMHVREKVPGLLDPWSGGRGRRSAAEEATEHVICEANRARKSPQTLR